MLITKSSFETQLGLIPPNYDQHLVIAHEVWVEAEYPNCYDTKSVRYSVFEPNQWNKDLLKRQYSSRKIVDWRLTKNVNNAPQIYVPSGMRVVVDAMYVCTMGYWTNTPVVITNWQDKGDYFDLGEMIHSWSASEENDYFYFSHRIESNPFVHGKNKDLNF